jgi:hypothetical protein
MMKVKFLALISLMLLMFSCENTTENESALIELGAPTEPEFTADLPLLPATSVHILQREYAHSVNSLKKNAKSFSLAEYMELRLLELYPETAYKGMMQVAIEEMDKYKAEYEQYLTELNEYYMSVGADSLISVEDDYREFTTLEDEIEFLEMTEEEIEKFHELEAFATSENLVSREVLDSLMGCINAQNRNELIKKSGILNPTFLLNAAGIAGYSTWRIIQSRDRAENKTEQYFDGEDAPGEKGDAFRHIYVSVLLRRYITRVGADAVMSGYEIVKSNDHKRDTYMDKHNNKVGRHTQYWTFRGAYLADRYKWELWAERAKDWVNNSSNGVFMDWYVTDPDKETAKSEEAEVDDDKYLYYR